jgi:cytochrome oxidase Cu insertion factor (SCO1/SenC/PrrC family)
MSKQLLVIIAMGVTGMLFPLYSKAELKVGDRAPDFALEDQNGKAVRLSDFSGKTAVVLAFYLRASTPG